MVIKIYHWHERDDGVKRHQHSGQESFHSTGRFKPMKNATRRRPSSTDDSLLKCSDGHEVSVFGGCLSVFHPDLPLKY